LCPSDPVQRRCEAADTDALNRPARTVPRFEHVRSCLAPAHRAHHCMERPDSYAAGRGGPTETRSAGLARELSAVPRGAGARAPGPGHTPRRRTHPATSAAAAAAAAHTLRRQSRPGRRRLRPGAHTAPARPPARAGRAQGRCGCRGRDRREMCWAVRHSRSALPMQGFPGVHLCARACGTGFEHLNDCCRSPSC